MNYTHDTDQFIFIKDADIARTIDGSNVGGDQISVNGVPAFDLFKERYDELSTYDSNLCAEIDNLSTEAITLSNEITGTMDLSVKNLQDQITDNDADISYLSGQHNWLSDELSNVAILSVKNLQDQVIANDNDIEFLSGQHDWLSDEISNVTTLSIQNLQGQVIANDNDIEFLSGVVELTISSDLYELSAGTKETSAMLSDQVKALWNDVRGGVNYKGHLKSYRDAEHQTVNLSDIYLHSFSEYTADTKLNNGWLYCFTTEETTGKYTTKDGIELEHRDYIVIHSHSDLSSIPVSDIGRDTIDIIDTSDDDYVRLNLLAEVSTALSTDYVGKIEALSISLSTTVSNDIDFLSGQHDWLSDEISTVVGLSVENLEGKIASDRADISYLSGQHDWLSSQLSTTMDLSVKNLQDQITDNDTDITNIQSYISGSNSLCTELSTVKYHYNKTFIEDDYMLGPDHKVDVLKVVNSANTTDTFKLIYLSGTLVLESLPAPEHEVEIEE